MSLRGRLTRYPALLLLIVTYVISTGVVVTNYYRSKGRTGQGQKTVLRIAHWQLEPGIRDAIDYCAEEFRKHHPEVVVKQILIPEEGYFRWVNTQLIGRTAPDMIETGMGSAQLWQKFYARYFMPLDQYVEQPNPYNEGTELEGLPWRQTYFDEMEGGYDEVLQSYFRVPLSAFTLRLYYNRDMVRDVWHSEGGSEFPETYEELARLCELLKEARPGKKFVPIAGADYSFERIDDIFQTVFTAPYLDRTDVDYNGIVSTLESAAPLYSGAIRMTEPPIRYNFQILREVADYSPPGATSMDREQAKFQFHQGRAAMIPTGSWDYSTLTEQADFEVAVTDFPIPTKDDPTYGPYVSGQPTEADTRGAFPFAITKVSKHPELALEFLQFASSLKMNEELNHRMYWIPVIRGAGLREGLEPFKPRVEGYSIGLQYEAPNTTISYTQKLPRYLSHELDYDQFVDDYMEAFRRRLPGAGGVQKYVSDLQHTLRAQMRRAATRRAAINGAVGATATITGQPAHQYRRIVEAYATQSNSLDHEVKLWVEHAKLRQQEQEKKE